MYPCLTNRTIPLLTPEPTIENSPFWRRINGCVPWRYSLVNFSKLHNKKSRQYLLYQRFSKIRSRTGSPEVRANAWYISQRNWCILPLTTPYLPHIETNGHVSRIVKQPLFNAGADDPKEPIFEVSISFAFLRTGDDHNIQHPFTPWESNDMNISNYCDENV